MDWDELTLRDLYYYYLNNGWKGSAALLVQQGREIVKKRENKKLKIEIVEAGVGPNHQVDYCDWCGKKLYKDENGYLIDGIQTCTHTEYVTLCYECKRKAGNRVR